MNLTDSLNSVVHILVQITKKKFFFIKVQTKGTEFNEATVWIFKLYIRKQKLPQVQTPWVCVWGGEDCVKENQDEEMVEFVDTSNDMGL